MSNGNAGKQLSLALQPAKQEREAPRYKRHAEPSVWNERMLTALENGVKGGKWFSLIDKVVRRSNLTASWAKVKSRKGAPGADGVTLAQFEHRLEQEFNLLNGKLSDATFKPAVVRRVEIPKPDGKKRPLGIPTVRDRVAQGATKNVIEPIFEKDFSDHSYGFRPGLGCKNALKEVYSLLTSEHVWVLDADIKSYFDTIDHEILLCKVREKIADGKVIKLIELYLKQGILDGVKEWTPETGTPQGAVLSPLLANIYLDGLDKLMENESFRMVRYADDFVILTKSESEAKKALEIVREYMRKHKLELHGDKTKIVDARGEEGFDFLGYNFSQGGKKRPRKKSLQKFKDKVRWLTRRSSGQSMSAIVEKLNPVLRGWFEYFKHSWKYIFWDMDSWIRRRLRSILMKFNKERTAHGGFENKRWPNAYFAELGLYSLKEAHLKACKSL